MTYGRSHNDACTHRWGRALPTTTTSPRLPPPSHTCYLDFSPTFPACRPCCRPTLRSSPSGSRPPPLLVCVCCCVYSVFVSLSLFHPAPVHDRAGLGVVCCSPIPLRWCPRRGFSHLLVPLFTIYNLQFTTKTPFTVCSPRIYTCHG